MDIVTFPDILPDIFLSLLSFSHNLCLSLFRRSISVTELTIHMQSKSHILCVYPSKYSTKHSDLSYIF